MRAFLLAIIIALMAYAVTADQSVSGCDVCQFFVKEIETEVSKYDGKITDLFKQQVCGKLPDSLQVPCTRFVDAFGVQAVKYLLNEFENLNVCKKLNLCENSEWMKNIFKAEEAFSIYKFMQTQVAQSSVQLDVSETPYCGICQFTIANLEQFVNQSESQIEQEALKLCKQLPSQYIQLCDTLVLVYLPNIIDQLLAQEPPQVACCQLTLCQDNCPGKKAIEAPKKPAVPAVVPAQDGQYCVMCQFVVSNVEAYLANNDTEQKIIAQVNQLCSQLPSQFSQACINMVDQWIPYVIYYIESNYPADKTCKLIGLCTSSQKTQKADMVAFSKLVIKQLPSQQVAAPKAKDQSLCQICTLAMTILQQYLNSNSTDQQIKQALETLCAKLPQDYTGMCTMLVDTYEPVLLSLIRQYITSHQLDQICHDIGVCSSAVQKQLNNAQVARLAINADSEFCAPCLFAVTYVDNQLNSTATRQIVKDALANVCTKLPSEYSSLCQILVVGKADDLINLVLSKLAPDEVCTLLKLCGPKRTQALPNPLAPLMVAEKSKKAEASFLCPICLEFVSVADSYLTSNSTIAEIKNVVESVVCSRFPASYKGVCDAFVEVQAPYLISAFVRGYLAPDAVCGAANICTSKTAAIRSFKVNKITVN
jgi:saposin